MKTEWRSIIININALWLYNEKWSELQRLWHKKKGNYVKKEKKKEKGIFNQEYILKSHAFGKFVSEQISYIHLYNF